MIKQNFSVNNIAFALNRFGWVFGGAWRGIQVNGYSFMLFIFQNLNESKTGY